MTTAVYPRLLVVAVLATFGLASFGLGACSISRVDEASVPTSVGIEPGAASGSAELIEGSSTSATSSGIAATTTSPPSATSSTAASTTVEPTTCGFVDQSAFDQIDAVEKGEAPTSEICASALSRAESAATVFDATRRFAEKYGIGDLNDEMHATEGCSAAGIKVRVTNTYDQPVIFWTLHRVQADPAGEPDDATPHVAEISPPVLPGESFAFDSGAIEMPDDAPCVIEMRALIAPMGKMAADAGLSPTADQNPQADDDPNVWLPALHLTDQVVNADPASFVPRVALAEDIHSPDLFVAREQTIAALEAGGVVGAGSDLVGVCGVVDVTEGRDDAGSLAMVSYASRSRDTGVVTAQVGLFRRGSDRVWRFAGRTIKYGGIDPDDPCAGAPGVK